MKPELEQKLAKETKTSLPSLPSVQPLSSFLCGLCSQWSRGHIITLRNHHPRCSLRLLSPVSCLLSPCPQ